MKKIILFTIGCFFAGIHVFAQDRGNVVVVDESPTILDMSFNPYYDYSQQGNASYINNSQFYNKDNFISSPLPAANGYYERPGNSNAINNELYDKGNHINDHSIAPSGTIYNDVTPYSSPVNNAGGVQGAGTSLSR